MRSGFQLSDLKPTRNVTDHDDLCAELFKAGDNKFMGCPQLYPNRVINLHFIANKFRSSVLCERLKSNAKVLLRS